MTIGGYPAWSVAAAREQAKSLRRKIDSGEDPLAAKEAERGRRQYRRSAIDTSPSTPRGSAPASRIAPTSTGSSDRSSARARSSRSPSRISTRCTENSQGRQRTVCGPIGWPRWRGKMFALSIRWGMRDRQSGQGNRAQSRREAVSVSDGRGAAAADGGACRLPEQDGSQCRSAAAADRRAPW